MPRKPASAVATPRAWRSPTLVLGPVSVKVGMKSISADDKIHAKTLCPCHNLPISQAATCMSSGEIVTPIKRYEYGDTYVEVDPADFKSESDYTIDLLAAPHDEDVDAVYFSKSYVIWPAPGFEQQYDMLKAAVVASARTLIGSAVLNSTTEVFAVRWSAEYDVLLVHRLEYAENIATADIELVREAADARPAPAKEYVELLTDLIATREPSYNAEWYTNDYRARLKEAIAAAANGTPIPKPATETAPAEVVDLMEALRASVAAAKKKPAAKSTTKKPVSAAKKKPAAKKPAAAKRTAGKRAA